MEDAVVLQRQSCTLFNSRSYRKFAQPLKSGHILSNLKLCHYERTLAYTYVTSGYERNHLHFVYLGKEDVHL